MNRTLIALAIIAVTVGIGYSYGASNVEKRWAEAEKQRIEALGLTERLAAKKRQDLETEIDNLRGDLREKEQDSSEALRSVTVHYAQQLLHSETRAAHYKHLAESGGSDCRSLADHAGRLDGALVEGQLLVGELTNALRKRNAQVNFLGGVVLKTRAGLVVDVR